MRLEDYAVGRHLLRNDNTVLRFVVEKADRDTPIVEPTSVSEDISQCQDGSVRVATVDQQPRLGSLRCGVPCRNKFLGRVDGSGD